MSDMPNTPLGRREYTARRDFGGSTLAVLQRREHKVCQRPPGFWGVRLRREKHAAVANFAAEADVAHARKRTHNTIQK